ncbi:MAG TPA: HAD family phosphatase [Actinomycetales bacterium]|nr:HAD family phosphatase [Actinomycetales bacterium]
MTVAALVVDWGGVLTQPLKSSTESWARADGVDPAHFAEALKGWRSLAEAEAGRGEDAGPVAALERGEIAVADFEVLLADELGRLGSPVTAQGLLGRMLAGLEAPEPAMFDVVRTVHGAGVATALLSNSWGNTYPREGWDDLFDAVVISGEVGMRKPEERIYRHAASLLDRPTEACVMVDDLPWNVDAARAAGMRAILHTDPAATAAELELLLGVTLT